jgi:hypothetical protein
MFKSNRELKQRVTKLEEKIWNLQMVVENMPIDIEKKRRVSEFKNIEPMTDVWVRDNSGKKPEWAKRKFIIVDDNGHMVLTLDDKTNNAKLCSINAVSLTKPKEEDKK